MTELREKVARAVETLRKETALLLQNAEGCAANHYGSDPHIYGMPPWLADTRKNIEQALADLTQPAFKGTDK